MKVILARWLQTGDFDWLREDRDALYGMSTDRDILEVINTEVLLDRSALPAFQQQITEQVKTFWNECSEEDRKTGEWFWRTDDHAATEFSLFCGDDPMALLCIKEVDVRGALS